MKKFAVVASAALALAGSLSAADPQLLNLVPPGTKILAGVNVDQARTSPFGQFVLSMVPLDAQVKEFVAMSGFDPRNDVHEVLVASTGPSEGMSHLVMVKGNFDVQKLLKLMPNASQAQNYAGAQLVVGRPHHEGAFAFLDAFTAIAGDEASVKSALDRRLLSNVLDPMIAARVTELSATEDAWAVSVVPLSSLAPAGTKGTNGPQHDLLAGELVSKIQQTSGGVKFGSSVQVSATAVTGDPKDAAALRDVVKFLALMAQSSAPKEAAPAVALMQNLNVVADGSAVKLAISVPEVQLESLVRMGMANHPATGNSNRRRGRAGEGVIAR